MKILIVYAFPFAMAMAAFLDIMTMKLPNRFVLVFAALFVPAALAVGMPLNQFGMHVAAGAVMLAVSFLLFIPGWIGGGDAKFFAAAALWMGWSDLFEYALMSAILGGLLTIVLLLLRSYPLPGFLARRDWAWRLHQPTTGIPYGVAMAVAGILIFPNSQWAAQIGM